MMSDEDIAEMLATFAAEIADPIEIYRRDQKKK